MSWHDEELCLGLEEPCTAGDGERCEACRLYTELSRAECYSAPSRPLPAGLGARLRAMNEDFAEADPLYVRALAGEPLGDQVPPEEADNPGRRAAHDALAVTFAEARQRRELPPALASKLRAIPRRTAAARLPIWLADSRWATAASLMLTAALALAAGDVSARFQAISDPAPIVSRLDAASWKNSTWKKPTWNKPAWKEPHWNPPDLAERRAELEALLEATDDQLAKAGEAATSEARGRLERFATWRRSQTDAARQAWQSFRDAAAERLELAVATLEETKIGQFVVDLLQEGENDD